MFTDKVAKLFVNWTALISFNFIHLLISKFSNVLIVSVVSVVTDTIYIF